MAVRLIYDKNYRLGVNVPVPSVAAVEIVPGVVSDIGLKVSGAAGVQTAALLTLAATTGQTGHLQDWTGLGGSSYVDKDAIFSFATAQFAAPAASSVKLASAIGSAATINRSDHVHGIDVSIEPTWSGRHTYTGGYVTINQGATYKASYALDVWGYGTAGSACPVSFRGAANCDFAEASVVRILGAAGATGPALTVSGNSNAHIQGWRAVTTLRSYVDKDGYIYAWDGSVASLVVTASATFSPFLLMGA